MEWAGSGVKLLPKGLPELIYQVTPKEIRDNTRFVINRKKEESYLAGYVMIDFQEGHVINLFPTIITENRPESPVALAPG